MEMHSATELKSDARKQEISGSMKVFTISSMGLATKVTTRDELFPDLNFASHIFQEYGLNYGKAHLLYHLQFKDFQPHVYIDLSNGDYTKFFLMDSSYEFTTIADLLNCNPLKKHRVFSFDRPDFVNAVKLLLQSVE